MAVEGNLRDLSLTGLVQTLCLEQRQAVLFLTRPGEKGTIYFEEGEIAHAETGSLEGEEAMYRLLAWPDGKFRLGEHVVIPRRTVSTPWSNLLLEAMRRIDEQERMGATPAERVLTPAEVQQDEDLENDLILLLSELEQARAQLAEEKSQKRPPLALQALAEMVNHVVAFAEERSSVDASRDALEQALAKACDAYPQARLLRIQYRRLSVQMVSKLYSSWAEDSAGRRETFLQIAQGMADILETYFSILTARFHSITIAKQWQDTNDVFTTDLKHVIDAIQF